MKILKFKYYAVYFLKIKINNPYFYPYYKAKNSYYIAKLINYYYCYYYYYLN